MESGGSSRRQLVHCIKLNLVHCIKLNVDTRASQKVHHKAPLAGKGGSLSKSGNAGVGLLGRSLRASRQATIWLRCIGLK